MNTSTPRPPTANTPRGKPRPVTIEGHPAAPHPDRPPTPPRRPARAQSPTTPKVPADLDAIVQAMSESLKLTGLMPEQERVTSDMPE